MKLDDLKTLRLLPAFMREDPANKALAEAWDALITALMPRFRLLSQWDRIDDLTEAELDELAWELNITWWLKHASMQAKRRTIRNADIVKATLGTNFAVEEVISTYYGEGYVIEWFEYEPTAGLPWHFSIYTANPTVTTARQAEFLWILDLVKRRTAVLDQIIMGMGAEFQFHAGTAYHELSEETHKIIHKIPPLNGGFTHYAGTGYRETSFETVFINQEEG